MSIQDTINTEEQLYTDIVKKILKAGQVFAKSTQRTRAEASNANFFEKAGKNGLAFLLLSNNSVASANEIVLLSKLSNTEVLLISQASANLAQGKAIGDGLPELTQKIKLLAQQHVISAQINELEESPHSSEPTFTFNVTGDGTVEYTGSINDIEEETIEE